VVVTASYPGGVGKFLLVIIAFGALVYLTFWWIERRRVRRGGSGGSGGRGVRPRRPSGPTRPPHAQGPDDDPDFLRRLEAERRRAARRKAQEGGDGGTPPPAPSA
jgi:hypothetical protein